MCCIACEKDIATGARFCPFCRAEQTDAFASPARGEEEEAAEAAFTLCSRCATPNPVGRGMCGSCSSPLLWSADAPSHQAATDASAVFARDGSRVKPFPSESFSHPAHPSGEVLVLRAGENVWPVEEEEGWVEPETRRPLLILDEQVVHLSHTDKRL